MPLLVCGLPLVTWKPGCSLGESKELMGVGPEYVGVESAYSFIALSSKNVRAQVRYLVRQHGSQLAQVVPPTSNRAISAQTRPQRG